MCFIKPNEINIGLDSVTQKKEYAEYAMQYVPLTTKLETLLQHKMFLQLSGKKYLFRVR